MNFLTLFVCLLATVTRPSQITGYDGNGDGGEEEQDLLGQVRSLTQVATGSSSDDDGILPTTVNAQPPNVNSSHNDLIGGTVDGLLLKNTTTAIPTVIHLSTKKTLSDVEELECQQSIFMSPFHDPVGFSVNESVGLRQDPTCKWNFFGTEPCIPMLSCQLQSPSAPDADTTDCDQEYLEVFDGYRGFKRYCAAGGINSSAIVNVTAADDLRDLYIRFKTTRTVNNNGNNNGGVNKFNCTVVCSNRGEGHPLPAVFQEKVNRKCSCGTKLNDDRIVGGVMAEKNEFPWLVALVETNTRQPFCGGSVVNDRMIVTAGHCFKGKFMDIRNIEVLLNAHVLDSTPNTLIMKEKPLPKNYTRDVLDELDRGNGSRRFVPEEAFVHPLYVSETNDFDVALILLSKPIDFLGMNKTARPVCLPEPGSYLRTFAGKKATVAGWGLQGLEVSGTPETLQKVDVAVFKPKECKAMYAHRVNRRMMCAGYIGGGMDSCSGDSGGPLVLEDKNKLWYQIGSVSWGDGCAREQSPGVYFRTTESGQWIHFNSNSNNAIWCNVPS